VFNATYSLSDPSTVNDGKWYGGEPLWVTAEREGLKAGCFFWPGSEAEIKGYRPSYYVAYDESVPYKDRVERVLEWLSYNATDRPSLITLYFESVDTNGHIYGPNTVPVFQAIQSVDVAIGLLLAGLEALKLTNQANIVITSDHGMTSISSQRVILLDDYVNLSLLTVVDWNPVAYILSNNESLIPEIFTNLSHAHPNLTVYLKQNIPHRYHYTNNRRITPILAVADLGWSITSRDYYERNPNYFNGGNHGYDNAFLDMRAIFTAMGPSFAKLPDAKGMQNIDVYTLLSNVLGLQPAPNNGSFSNVQYLLKK